MFIIDICIWLRKQVESFYFTLAICLKSIFLSVCFFQDWWYHCWEPGNRDSYSHRFQILCSGSLHHSTGQPYTRCSYYIHTVVSFYPSYKKIFFYNVNCCMGWETGLLWSRYSYPFQISCWESQVDVPDWLSQSLYHWLTIQIIFLLHL